MTTRTTLEDVSDAEPASEMGLGLLVMSPEAFVGLPLPTEGSVTVGRSMTCDIQVEDPLASRRHARLHLGKCFAIEDLGSANGTRVRRERIAPGVRVPVSPGEAIEIGSTVLLLHVTSGPLEPRRLWSHVYFEGSLRNECARAEAMRGRFALARLQLDRPVPWPEVVPILVRDLPAPHMFAAYAPREFELLLRTPAPEEAARLIDTIRASLAKIDVSVRVGIAWYQRDGRSADALIARASALLRPSATEPALPPAVSLAPEMKVAHDMAARAAQSNINVLLLGEMGVGKEVMAQMIHRMSARAEHPLVALNCAALTETLIESELFGHEKGAFSGAFHAKKGLLEAADGGTVFLDEIGEMPPSIQAKLLRVIEAREVLAVGAVKVRPINVRFIAATNRDLDAAVAAGKFRGDLLFRLNTFAITIPPLRLRRSEILPLARLFVAQAARAAERQVTPELSPAAESLMLEYAWPGNVRELRNVVERAVVLCQGEMIGVAELPVESMGGTPPLVAGAPGSEEIWSAGRLLTTKQIEDRRRIIDALQASVWNQSRAAKLLGMPRRTLVAKIVRYGIPRPTRALTIARNDSDVDEDSDVG